MSEGRQDRSEVLARCRLGTGGSVCVFGLACILSACGGRPTEPIVLDAPSSVRVSKNSPAALSVVVPADLAIRLLAHSPEVNVRLEARDAIDATWRVADAPGLRTGTDLIYFEPGPERSIDIRLVAVDEAVATGDVSLAVEALPDQGRRDSLHNKAVRTESEACAANVRKEGGDSETAELFAAAARGYERAGSSREAAVAAYHEAAIRYYVAADWDGAVEVAAAVARSASRLGLDELAAHSIALEGAALIEAAGNLPRDRTGEAPAIFDRSRQRLLEAAERFERLELTYHRAYAINYRGVAYHYQGLWDEADAEYGQAADLFRQAGSQRAEAMSLQNRALVAYERGNYPEAIARFDEALRLHSEAGEEESYAHALHNSGLAAQAIGAYDEALSRFHRAAVRLRQVGDAAGEARALHAIGVTFKVAGEPERARALLEQAIPLRKAAKDRRGLLTTLVALGDVERMQGRLDEATALHREALSFATSAQERNWALLGLGRDLVAGAEEGTALETFDAVIALPLPETHPGKGHAYLERAALVARRDGYAAAVPDFDRALAIHAGNGADVAAADAFQHRASARLQDGLVVESLADADHALTILERTGLEGVHADLRAEFLGARRDAYEIRIAALLQLAEVARQADDEERARELELAAFATSERSRARQLLDALASRAASDDGSPANSARAELYQQLVGKMARRDALLDRPEHDQNADLVVLSACETAVGKHVSGEGLLGLSHAFLQAGARTVVASLWQVPDAATAVLMREFYRQLLDGRVTPTRALQLAQKRVASERKWRSPYYWAGFQVTSSAYTQLGIR